MPTTRIAELASIINENTAKFEEYLSSHNLPTPSFEPDALLKYDLPPEIAQSRQSIIEASDELHHLMIGPIDVLTINAVCLNPWSKCGAGSGQG